MMTSTDDEYRLGSGGVPGVTVPEFLTAVPVTVGVLSSRAIVLVNK